LFAAASRVPYLLISRDAYLTNTAIRQHLGR
jgi:hypothetical protein